jgi:ABC-type Fe3+/spermidine/putrescine transport system ATPase subunit
LVDIILKNIRKTFGEVIAVDSVSLKIYDREYLTLLGPSGCGKTTTLRIIAGLERATSGELLFGDEKIGHDIPPEDRNIGMVFQHFEIFPFLDVWDNVAYSCRVRGLDKIETEDRVSRYIKLVNLGQHGDKFPYQLTAPQLQRIGIARALATGSKILLLDEPLGSLDQRYRDEFRIEMRKLVKELNITAIHVTHDQDEAMMISDRIAVMRQGRILQVGAPGQLYIEPNSIFVANFIGESNFLEGEIRSIKGNARIRLHGGGPNIHSSDTQGFNRRDRVVASIRKEFVGIKEFTDSITEKKNIIKGKVNNIAFLGSYLRITVQLRNGDLIEAKIVYPPEFKIEENMVVGVKMHPDNLLLFPYPKDLDYELALE